MTRPAPCPADEGLARDVEDEFLELIYSDPDLLGLQFDAIIAEEWPTPPARTPGSRSLAPSDRGASHPELELVAVTPGRAPRLRVGGWARQRSPPAG